MKRFLKVFVLLGVPCVPEHGIRTFMKSRNFERVSDSGIFVHLWPMGGVPLRSEYRFHLEIVFVSSKTVSICSRNTNFNKSEGIMLQ